MGLAEVWHMAVAALCVEMTGKKLPLACILEQRRAASVSGSYPPPPAKFFRSYHLQNGIRVCGFNYKMVAWTKMLLFRADLQCSDGETILFAVFLKQILTFPAVQNTVNFFSPGKTIAHLNRGVGGVNNTFLSYPEQVVVCVWVFMEDDLCCHFPI